MGSKGNLINNNEPLSYLLGGNFMVRFSYVFWGC